MIIAVLTCPRGQSISDPVAASIASPLPRLRINNVGAACEEEAHAAASRRGSHSACAEGCSGRSSCSGGEFKGGHCEREDATSSCCRDQKADEGVCADIAFLEMSDAVAV